MNYITQYTNATSSIRHILLAKSIFHLTSHWVVVWLHCVCIASAGGSALQDLSTISYPFLQFHIALSEFLHYFLESQSHEPIETELTYVLLLASSIKNLRLGSDWDTSNLLVIPYFIELNDSPSSTGCWQHSTTSSSPGWADGLSDSLPGTRTSSLPRN